MKKEQKRSVVVEFDVIDDDPNDMIDILSPEHFDGIFKQYLEEISGRLDNIYGIVIKNIVIK